MRNNWLFAALLAAGSLAFGPAAEAHFADAWLAQCSAVAAGSCTEVATTGYARQPIFFNSPTSGTMVNGQAFLFPPGPTTIAGRALFDAQTGGHLVAVIPFGSGAFPIQNTNGDQGDVGAIQIALTGFSGIPGDLIGENLAAGATLGTNAAKINGAVDGSTVTTGIQVAIGRGQLAADLGRIDPFYVATANQSAGFTVTVPQGVTTYQVNGAATLATGTVNLQAAPADGATQLLLCGVAVTTLTVNVPATWTAVGTLPTTCGPNAGGAHEFRYFLGAKKVITIF